MESTNTQQAPEENKKSQDTPQRTTGRQSAPKTSILKISNLDARVNEFDLLGIYKEHGAFAVRIARNVVSQKSYGKADVYFSTVVEAHNACRDIESINTEDVSQEEIRRFVFRFSIDNIDIAEKVLAISNVVEDHRQIRAICQNYGRILGITIDHDEQLDTQVALVEFSSSQEVDRAVAALAKYHKSNKNWKYQSLQDLIPMNLRISPIPAGFTNGDMYKLGGEFGVVRSAIAYDATKISHVKHNNGDETEEQKQTDQKRANYEPFGFICFNTYRDGKKALQGLQGRQLEGSEKPLTATRATTKKDKRFIERYTLRNDRRNHYSTVLLKELSAEVRTDDLKNIFSNYGKILFHNIVADFNGQMGVVTFDNDTSAEVACKAAQGMVIRGGVVLPKKSRTIRSERFPNRNPNFQHQQQHQQRGGYY
mmetsp:Transcript_1620/g.1720  ORF Transcript_1620/g.1720 Transcript_1620/m.1720 type:complete len:424 (-) Transcript_1620:268-1539(-)